MGILPKPLVSAITRFRYLPPGFGQPLLKRVAHAQRARMSNGCPKPGGGYRNRVIAETNDFGKIPTPVTSHTVLNNRCLYKRRLFKTVWEVTEWGAAENHSK